MINNLQRKKNYFASYFLCFTFFINHLPLNALPKVTKSSVFKIKNKNKNKVIQLSIRRFQSEQGKPVILSHPLALSNLAMEKLGYALWQQGYDVWMPNTRGHGRKEERSIVHPYKRNDYGFDKIITEDWPYLLKYIYQKKQQKIIILGHSMGGMSWEQTLSGVYSKNGSIKQSDEISRERAKMVSSFIAVTTPPHLKKIPSSIKAITYSFTPIVSNFPFYFPIEVEGKYSRNRSLFSKKPLSTFRNDFIYRVFEEVLPYGIVEESNTKAKNNELKNLLFETVSSPHTDSLSDFFRWIRSQYESKDKNVSYEKNKNIFAPTLLIAAGKDLLAPPTPIKKSMSLYPKTTPIKFINFKKYSHLDILFESNITTIIENIINFDTNS